LSDDEVRDIGTADNSEPPVLGRGQDVITASLVPDRIAIEWVPWHLLEARILDRYACRRTGQRAHTV